jgi:cytochrome b pre-mRNA-processing protein 3
MLTPFLGCSLPPTFQSWFTVTNLHVWLLTTRLRALPAPAAQQHIQALIDHFFFDVEDRIRLVLRAAPNRGAALPVAVPSASPSSPNRSPSERARGLKPFYAPPRPLLDKDGKPIRRFAPERLVGLQMRVLKEQWAGLGLALDLGLVRGDTELAGAVWRNLLGGRGAAGIALPWAGMTPEEDAAHFRRAVNLVGGSAVEVRRVDLKGLDKEEKADDFSGVRDYRPSEVGGPVMRGKGTC